MKLKIIKGSENYVGTVVKIDNLHPIEGADFIQYTIIQGNSVIISKDVKIGDIMIYYVSGTKLDHWYCRFNNLYTNKEYNFDRSAKTGYLSHKQRRVKAIKLRGIISNGFILPLSSLKLCIGDSFKELKIGDTFNKINEEVICEKYIPPIAKDSVYKNSKGKKPKRFDRLIPGQFYFHNSTEHLAKNMDHINPQDIIGVHYKKHGTSVCIANIPVLKPLKWYNKFLKYIGIKITDIEYDIIYSSRSVVKNQYLTDKEHNHFYGEDIWGVVAKEVGHLVPKNWTLYGEIIGYTPNGTAIQKGYDYGCNPGEHKFYVYKISVVNPDGEIIYLTDEQIAEYCNKVGLLYEDTLVYYGRAYGFYNMLNGGPSKGRSMKIENWRNKFLSLAKDFYEGSNCVMCKNKVPTEGMVIRVESLYNYIAFKLKTEAFILRESNLQDKEEVDIEDIS